MQRIVASVGKWSPLKENVFYELAEQKSPDCMLLFIRAVTALALVTCPDLFQAAVLCLYPGDLDEKDKHAQ